MSLKEQFGEIAKTAEQVSAVSNEYYNYLGSLKSEFEILLKIQQNMNLWIKILMSMKNLW